MDRLSDLADPSAPRPKQVDIMASTVSGTSKPLAVINGSSAGSNAVCLDVESGSSGSRIQNLVIDGFGATGIDVDSTNDSVTGCYIGKNGAGTVAVPNGSSGIDAAASGATIGAAGAGNIIAFNVGPGVAIEPGATGSTVRFNSIFGNTGPGIDLNDDGVTPNTPSGARVPVRRYRG